MSGTSLYPEQQLRRRAMAWARELKVNPTQIVIRDLTDKWGSCAPDGVVTLAEDLAGADEDLQDYVIVHELLHLRHRGHGKVFKALLAAHVPDWAEVEHRMATASPTRGIDAPHEGQTRDAVSSMPPESGQ